MTSTKYELMVILQPDLGEDETKKQLDEIRSLITEQEGEIYSEDIWGIQEFAYTIKKQNEGYYAVFYFSMPSIKVKELDSSFNLNQQLIRFLITKTPHDFEIKTFDEYQEEAEIKSKEREKKRNEKKDKIAKKETKPTPKVKKTEPKEEPKEEPKKEKPASKPKEEPKEEPKKEEPKDEPKEEKKEKKADLNDFDEKLKSLINDPDISL